MKSKVWLLFVLSSLLFGCEDDAESTDKKESDDKTGEVQKLEIFSWWTAPGEIDALQALINVFTGEFPNVEVINLSTVEGHGDDARERLNTRMAENNPPDTFQLGPRDFQLWVEYNGNPADNRLEPLDVLFQTEGWTNLFPAGVLEVLKYNGSFYAVPVNMHRQNTLFYNKTLVPTPPTTLEEFFTLAATLQEDQNITPLALSAGTGGWTLEIVFYSLLAGSAGNEYFRDFFVGALDMTNADNLAKLEKAVDDYLQLLQYTNVNAGELGWDQAAELLHKREAAMYIHGDWAKGYYMSLGWNPGVDFGVASALGSQGAFIYNVDTFALCKGAPNRDIALEFLRVIGGAQAQEAFNIVKGSSPVHPGVDTTSWDQVAKDTFADLDTATIIHNVEIHQFTVNDAEGNEVGLADQLLAMYQSAITREDLIAWITSSYVDATQKK